MPGASADPMAAWAAADGAFPAVVENGAVTTRAALNADVNRLAGGLAALGVKAGECAVWCGPNSVEVVVAMQAFRKLGLVAVPLPYRLTAEEAHHVLADSGAAVVLVDARCASVIAGLLPRLPALRHAVSFGGPCPGMRSWEDVTALGSAGEPPPPPEHGTAMMYTSGTTGRPKGAVRSRSDRALLGAMMAELNFGAATSSPEVHLVTGPLYHAGPNAFALLTHITGGTLVVMAAFDAAEWLRLVADRRVTSAFVAPTHLKRIVSLPDDVLAAADVSSLRSLIVNAAPVPYALKQEVLAKLGEGFLYEVYGSTELGIATVLRPEDQLRKPGSCGRPYGGIELRVVGDDGAAVPTGQPGELFVRTALAIDGYHRATAQLTELPGDGRWKSVGDVAWLDGEGYLHICDRRTDMVITGGMNVYPAEVEGVLHAHPDVADAAVIGVPDAEWGERVHAVVQPKAGRDVEPAELVAFVAPRLAGYKRPRSWEVRSELPRTESGKLLKRQLRAEHGAGGPGRP
ncbi:MAG: AMP-binding protein [Actinomycetota bacterium]|nr:AMP-binding protein [Actinomycetota bacterium]